MKSPRPPGRFDVEERAAQLTEKADPLVGLKAGIDGEAFRSELKRVPDKERKSQGGSQAVRCGPNVQDMGAATSQWFIG